MGTATKIKTRTLKLSADGWRTTGRESGKARNVNRTRQALVAAFSGRGLALPILPAGSTVASLRAADVNLASLPQYRTATDTWVTGPVGTVPQPNLAHKQDAADSGGQPGNSAATNLRTYLREYGPDAILEAWPQLQILAGEIDGAKVAILAWSA